MNFQKLAMQAIFILAIGMIGILAGCSCGDDDDDDDNNDAESDDDSVDDDSSSDDDATDDDSADDDDADECLLEQDICDWLIGDNCTNITMKTVADCLQGFLTYEQVCKDWDAAMSCFCDCKDQGLTCYDFLFCCETGCIPNHCA